MLGSTNPATDSGFGIAVSISRDGLALAVGERDSNIPSVDNAGTVQLYTKTQIDAPWETGPLLVSSAPDPFHRFGSTVQFSPDGTTLAVAELHTGSGTNRDTGSVYLFARSGATWSNIPTIGPILISQDPNNAFGTSFNFSPNSTTLTVGEYFGNTPDGLITGAGSVQLFIREGTTWNAIPRHGPVITSTSPVEYNVSDQATPPLRYSCNVGLVNCFARTA